MAVLTFAKALDLFPALGPQRTTAFAEITPGGLSIKVVDFTSDSAYSFPGYDLGGNVKKFGMSAILVVLQASARAFSGALLNFPWAWDAQFGTLAFMRNPGGTGALAGAQAADVPAGSVIRVTLLGRP